MEISQHALARPYINVLANTKVAAMGGAFAGEAAKKGPTIGAALQRIGGTLSEHGSWLVPLASATATGIATIAERMTAASRKGNAFKAMIGANPHLADKPAEDTQRYFNVLYALNPEFAHEPTVAGSFVTSQIGLGHNPSAPHAGVFDAALKLRGGGGGQKGPSAGASIVADLGNAARAGQAMTDREKRIQEFTKSFVSGQRDAELQKKMKIQDRHMSLTKNRERSAMGKLDQAQSSMQGLSAEAARFEQLLDQHGIPHR